MSTLTIDSVTKSFKAVQVLKGVDLEVRSGEFISLLGPSGCGKTTLLRCIAGLETTTSGRVLIGNEDVTSLPPEKRKLGMMFQSYALFPHMSVRENVRFGHRMEGKESKKDQLELAQAALERVQMGHLADRMPAQLSGGQQQRVALARAIATTPRLLLLDEPLSNLDARLREDMQIELKELHGSLGVTTVFVTHDQEEALSLSDRIVLMHGGVVEQVGTPDEVYSTPTTTFAADFIGGANLLPATRSGDAAKVGGASVCIPLVQTGGDGTGSVMLRQEDIILADEVSETTPHAVQIVTRVFRGADIVYLVSLGDQQLKIVAPRHTGLSGSGSAAIGWQPDAARWIPESGTMRA
ncbi:MAG: ABC transporter ATP-binding protein [Leucobacter sp.]